MLTYSLGSQKTFVTNNTCKYHTNFVGCEKETLSPPRLGRMDFFSHLRLKQKMFLKP